MRFHQIGMQATNMAGVCVALVSGGIDSPVAVARMLMNGWKIYPVHASQEPITGPEGESKANGCGGY